MGQSVLCRAHHAGYSLLARQEAHSGASLRVDGKERALLCRQSGLDLVGRLEGICVECVRWFSRGVARFVFFVQNSIRHNLSLHTRFMRVTNEGPGKSSWWVINPDAKAGRPARRRAMSTDATSSGNKSETKRRGRHNRSGSKGAIDTATAAGAAGSPAPSPAPSSTRLYTSLKADPDATFSQHCLTPSSLCDSDSSTFGGGSTSPYDGFSSPLGDAAPFSGPLPGTSEQFGTDYFYDQDQSLFASEIATLADPLASLSVSNHQGLHGELDPNGSFPPITIDSAPINPAPSTYVAPFQPSLSPISGTPFATPHGTPPTLRHPFRAAQGDDARCMFTRSVSTEQIYPQHQQLQSSWKQSFGHQPCMMSTGSWQHLNQPNINNYPNQLPYNPPPYYSQSWSPTMASSCRGYSGSCVTLSPNDYHPLMPTSYQHEPMRLSHNLSPMLCSSTSYPNTSYPNTSYRLSQSSSEHYSSNLDAHHHLRDDLNGIDLEELICAELPLETGLAFDFDHFREDGQTQPTINGSNWSHEHQWVH